MDLLAMDLADLRWDFALILKGSDFVSVLKHLSDFNSLACKSLWGDASVTTIRVLVISYFLQYSEPFSLLMI